MVEVIIEGERLRFLGAWGVKFQGPDYQEQSQPKVGSGGRRDVGREAGGTDSHSTWKRKELRIHVPYLPEYLM